MCWFFLFFSRDGLKAKSEKTKIAWSKNEHDCQNVMTLQRDVVNCYKDNEHYHLYSLSTAQKDRRDRQAGHGRHDRHDLSSRNSNDPSVGLAIQLFDRAMCRQCPNILYC